MAKKPASGFNTPFRALKITPPAPAPAPSKQPPPVEKKRDDRGTAASDDDERLFQQAMRGVTPLAAAERARRASPLGASPAAPTRASLRATARREEALAEAALVELVAQPGRLTVEEQGEAVAAFADGVDRRLLRRLRAGDHPVDAEIDLHGHDRASAAAALARAFKNARAAGQRCLLVIHGRGLNSGEEGPVLKAMAIQELSGGALSRQVLAFVSAPPSAGGAG
ncbi:MAG TPA: Smr/MutS family protein, partial [Polyangia bacterium]|nr:Smr/MutS family protein [Polyangia bacterium]